MSELKDIMVEHGLDNHYRTHEQIRLRIGELIRKSNGYRARLNELKPEHHLYDVIKVKIKLLKGRIDNLIFWYNY